jgi:hypothetical protein
LLVPLSFFFYIIACPIVLFLLYHCLNGTSNDIKEKEQGDNGTSNDIKEKEQ